MKKISNKQVDRIAKTLLMSGIGITIGAIIIQTAPNPVGVAAGIAFIIGALFGINYAIELSGKPKNNRAKRPRVKATKLALRGGA